MPISGDVYGQQVTPKFNSPFEVLSQVEQLRAQQENRRALKEQRELLAAQRQEQIAKSKRDNADVAAIDAAYAGGGEFEDILSKLPGHLRSVVGKQLNDATEFNTKAQAAKAAAEKAELDYAAHLASGVLYWQKDGPEAVMNAAQTALAVAKKHGHDVSQIEQIIAQDPTKLGPMLESIVARQRGPQAPKADYTMNDQRFSGETNQPIATAAPPAPKLGTFEDFLASYAKQRNLTPAQLSAGDKLKAKSSFEAAGRAPEKPTYEWAQTAEGTRYLTPGEIRAQGATKPIVATDKGKFKNAEPVLNGIEELSAKINTGEGILAKMGGGAAKLAAKANLDDDVAEYQALVSGFTPMVARALGHTGVLTQQDVDSVKALFPLPGDSKTLRDRKMKRVRGIISELEGAPDVTKAGAPATATPPAAGRVRVKGPNGETGTMPATSALPPGWSKVG